MPASPSSRTAPAWRRPVFALLALAIVAAAGYGARPLHAAVPITVEAAPR